MTVRDVKSLDKVASFVKWQSADMEDLGAAIERAWDFEDPAGSEAGLATPSASASPAP